MWLFLRGFLSAETSEAALWLFPKQNAELYIFHEPEGLNFMLADTDLLPAKLFFFPQRNWGALLLPSFVLFIKDNYDVTSKKYTVRLQINYA